MKYDSYGFVFREKYKVIDLGEKIYNHNSLSHLKSSRKWIQHLDVNNFDVFTLRLSSGCPFKCNFCHLSKRNSRYRDVEVIIDELSTFSKTPLSNYYLQICLQIKWVQNLRRNNQKKIKN